MTVKHSVQTVIIDPKFPLTIAALSDSHIPGDQAAFLPEFLDEVRSCKPDLILHAGDMDRRRFLAPLEEIAPLYVTRGNHDLLEWSDLPGEVRLQIGKIRLVLCHGEGGLVHYLHCKCVVELCKLFGREFPYDRITKLPDICKDADICIYGHTHLMKLDVRDGKLLVNPGCSFRDPRPHDPSFAILRFEDEENCSCEIRVLRKEGWRVFRRAEKREGVYL